MKRNASFVLAALFVGLFSLFGSGCAKYDKPEYVEVEGHQTAFLIPLEGDTKDQSTFASVELLEEKKVAAKRVQITHRWSQTGRMWYDGDWIGNVKLIVVDRKPVSRHWSADKDTGDNHEDDAVWVESKDSVTFSMGFMLAAEIPEPKASTFLYRYPNKSLAEIMDKEVRAHVQRVAAEWAAKYELYDVRSKKAECMEQLRKEVVPYFAARGIEITSIGMANGVSYKNKDIQQSIDKAVQDQQLKVQYEAQRQAQEVANQRIISEAKAKAEAESQAVTIKAKAQSEALKLLMQNGDMYLQLKALEVESERLQRWDGKLPQYYLGGGAAGPQMFLPMPGGPPAAAAPKK